VCANTAGALALNLKGRGENVRRRISQATTRSTNKSSHERHEDAVALNALRPPLLRYLKAKFRNIDHEDVVQETMLVGWCVLVDDVPRAEWLIWLQEAGRRRALHSMRHHWRQCELIDNLHDESFCNVDEQLDARAAIERVVALEHDDLLVLLEYAEGSTCAEVAARLFKAECEVWQMLARARYRVRQIENVRG
jgi:DNA-directed RNA polymerase specialized sigma24 family protein